MNASSHEGGPRRGAARIEGAAKSAAALGHNMVRNLARWCRALARKPRSQNPPLAKAALIAVALSLAAALASMFLIDAAATVWARHLPQGMETSFEQITNAGYSTWFLVPAAIIVLGLAALASPALPRLAQGALAALAARFGFLFLAIGAPGLFTTILKRLIGRARPYADINGDPFTYVPFAWRPEYASLPSGHSATVGAAAMAIGAIWPRTRPVMWLYALVIMFSRIVVLSHHPSDAIAGALVGAVGAAMVRRIFAARRLAFSPRTLAVLPGPSLRRTWGAIRRAIFAAASSSKHSCPIERSRPAH